MPSPASVFAALPADQRQAFLDGLGPDEAAQLRFNFDFWAHDHQRPPIDPDWRVWLLLAGRGVGKSLACSQFIRGAAESGRCKAISLIAATMDDARKTCVESSVGLLNISPPWCQPEYSPALREVRYPNGSTVTLFSAEEPAHLRGPNSQLAVCDELSSWQRQTAQETWDNIQFSTRIPDEFGGPPRIVVATTPKASKLLQSIVDDPSTRITRAHTLGANAPNLDPKALKYLQDKYSGTRVGRQELAGELLTDVEGALLRWDDIERNRIAVNRAPRWFKRVVVGVDPSMSSTGDEWGIVTCAIDDDGVGYVIADDSCRGSPLYAARRVVAAYQKNWADKVVAETNAGGAMVETTLRTIDKNLSYRGVHAMHGKRLRAEPVASLVEQDRVKFVGTFPALESELTSWVPGDPSPNRLDAWVYALTDLMINRHAPDRRYESPRIIPLYAR